MIICFVQGANAREVADLKLDDDPVPMLLDYFGREIERAQTAGVSRIIIDPGQVSIIRIWRTVRIRCGIK